MLNKIKLGNKVYDVLKWTLLVGYAPTVTLITGLGELYNFDTSLIIGTFLKSFFSSEYVLRVRF